MASEKPTPTKKYLSDDDISDLKKEVDKITGYMCNITKHISTPIIERGCNMSKDLEDIINNMTPVKANEKVIEDIRATLEDINYIAMGVEVGAEEILEPARKTKKHFHLAKKLVTSALPTTR